VRHAFAPNLVSARIASLVRLSRWLHNNAQLYLSPKLPNNCIDDVFSSQHYLKRYYYDEQRNYTL
jgi:hypothetical protein